MLNPKHKLYKWGPISACPLFMYFAIETAFAPLKKLFGITYTESLIIFKDEKVTWFLDDKALNQQSIVFVKNVLLNKQKNKKYFSLWNNRTIELTKLFNKLDRLNLSSLSNKVLVAEYKEFSQAYYDWFIITISIELGSSSLEPLLGSRLKKYFSPTQEKEYQQAFSVVTAPLSLTFYRQEQRDLLKILSLPKKRWEDSLKSHQEKYFWIFNSYAEGKVLPINYFRQELEKFTKENYEKILHEIENYVENIKIQKKEIISELQIEIEDIKLISLVETYSKLLDERKMINFKAEHYLELFAKEISLRTNHPIQDIKFLLPFELADSLYIINPTLIKKRRRCFVLLCTDKKIKHYTDKKAKDLADQFLGVTNIYENIIHGRVASVGKSYYFRGTAKVVLTIKEIGKIKKGDILVTTMTSPDFVIGMKKAGAIVTDTGGILSHAAIVSRELKIPCIVGTELATKIIHDGDIVELHCGRGTVKIIKHS